MTNILFWNLNHRRRSDLLCQVTNERSIDLIILAESDDDEVELTKTLSEHTGQKFCKPWSPPGGKLKILTRLLEVQLQPVFEDETGRLTIRRLITDTTDILVAAVHLASKMHWDDIDQDHAAQQLSAYIAGIENDRGHQRTIVVGDFNMNPFQAGLCSSHGFHGVMTKRIAAEGSRKVAGKDWSFFYNPMWASFGDQTDGPPGTYFFRSGKPLTYFWNIFDQVLIRPALVSSLRGSVDIVDTIQGRSLLDAQHRPDPEVGSDHLPIAFSLDV